MLIPDNPIERLWLELPPETKDRVPGLLLDEQGRLWFTDGFRAEWVEVKEWPHDTPGWVPAEAIVYCRQNAQKSIRLTDEAYCIGARFERSPKTTPKMDVVQRAPLPSQD